MPDVHVAQSGAGNYFAYERDSTGITRLIASHCPDGPATDLYGLGCPQGDWAAPGWELVPLVQAWPGMMIMRTPSADVPQRSSAIGLPPGLRRRTSERGQRVLATPGPGPEFLFDEDRRGWLLASLEMPWDQWRALARLILDTDRPEGS